MVACEPVPKAMPTSMITSKVSGRGGVHGGRTVTPPAVTGWWKRAPLLLPAALLALHEEAAERAQRGDGAAALGGGVGVVAQPEGQDGQALLPAGDAQVEQRGDRLVVTVVGDLEGAAPKGRGGHCLKAARSLSRKPSSGW